MLTVSIASRERWPLPLHQTSTSRRYRRSDVSQCRYDVVDIGDRPQLKLHNAFSDRVISIHAGLDRCDVASFSQLDGLRGILPAASLNSSSLASVVLFFDPFFRPGLPGLKGFPRIGFALLRGAGVGADANGGGLGSFVIGSHRDAKRDCRSAGRWPRIEDPLPALRLVALQRPAASARRKPDRPPIAGADRGF